MTNRCWRFLEDDMCVGAADPECAQPCAPRSAVRRPGTEGCHHVDGKLAPWDLPAQLGRVQCRRNRAVAERERDLEEADHARGRLEVTDVRLRRADQYRFITSAVGAVHVSERLDLDWISQRGPGAVAL